MAGRKKQNVKIVYGMKIVFLDEVNGVITIIAENIQGMYVNITKQVKIQIVG